MEERNAVVLRTSNLIAMEAQTAVLAAPSAVPASTSGFHCEGNPCHVARCRDRGMPYEVAFPPRGYSALRPRVA